MRALAAILLLTVLALAGCATKSGTPASGSHTLTGTGTQAATGSASPVRTATAAGAPAAGAPPTGNATAVPGAANSTASTAPPTATLTLGNATGAIPFNATFQAGGSADGGNLTFTLSFGDGSADATGSSLPASIVHAYTLTGNFTARLTVSDGTRSANATALVHAMQAASTGFAPIHKELTVAAYCELCEDMMGNPAANNVFCVSFQAGVPGADCTWAELPAGSAGHAFTATSDATLGAAVDVAFTADCKGTSEIVEFVPYADPTTGVVPAGAGCIVLWDYDGPANITIKLDIA